MPLRLPVLTDFEMLDQGKTKADSFPIRVQLACVEQLIMRLNVRWIAFYHALKFRDRCSVFQCSASIRARLFRAVTKFGSILIARFELFECFLPAA